MYPNWFNQFAKPNFEKFLTPLAGEIRLRFLQLGVYTGDATIWMCENILTSQSSLLDDVDTWQGSDEPAHEVMDFEDVYKTYLDKTADYQDGIIVHRKYTTAYLMDYRTREKEYDFIYIDADHTTVGVLMDAELSWPLLKSGGIMAFDDYKWGCDSAPELTPAPGIDLFLARHADEYEKLVINEQVWIRKNDN
jgi:predicted O-methyltransferase YrrM